MTELAVSGLIKYKEKLLFLLKVFLAVGLIWFIISVVSINEIVAGIKNARPEFITAAFLLSFFNLYIQYIKWKFTCSLLLNENSSRKILTSLFYGLTGGSFTPGRVGEYFGRGLPFKNKTLLQVAAATFVDKIFPLFVTAFFGSVSSVLFIHYYYGSSLYLTAGLFITLFVLFSLLIFYLFNSNTIIWLRSFRKYKWFENLFSKINVIKNINPGYMFKMMLLSLLFYACFIIQYALLAAAFSDDINFINYIWSGNLVMFAKTIIPPVSLGELGVREGASVFFLSKLGSTASAGFNTSIFLFLINVLLPSIAGMLLMLKRNDN